MNKELIIDSTASEVVIALLEEKRLVELNNDKSGKNFAVGDLYLGKVKKIIPGLNAAFVDVGYEKDAFLHYLDLGSQILSLNKMIKMAMSNKQGIPSMEDFRLEKEIEKTGKISNVINVNQQILVQVAKEPISTKGPRISSEISFAGRYLVLVPFNDKISVSQKIKNPEERNRLKRLVQSIRPKNFGIIIRTVAENRMVAELDTDLRELVHKWDSSIAKLATSKAPVKILGELNRTSAILRDLLNESFNNIHVNDQRLFDEIRNYVHTISPDLQDIVKLYKGKAPIFEHFGVEKQIKTSFGKNVSIKSGAYLIIEHTEALHVIDVNSGHRTNAENNQEQNALDVNLEAASEVARQLRLRDMGGIIVIDFIDMHDGHNRRKLYERLRDEMRMDRAKHTILPPSKFGLVQITRQRVRPEMNIETVEKCPVCDGTGEIKASIIYVDEIENNIKYLIQNQNEKFLKMCVHPYIYAYLTKGIPSVSLKWFLKFKKRIRIVPMSSYHLLEYHFFNKDDDEIKL
ncbi:MAG TPA: Rne/Rng family ribonuclease [Bacteroidales bacterium]|nr:Rne/Rng family ribonuclease [Bacteroidales bacterium]HPS16465.1 Rne/Rng family ribonuclease [Bacteroidales bacterium]